MAKYIRYTGTSHVRQITKQEWVGVGVHDQDTVVWNRANNFLVPLKSINDAAFPFIEADSELIIEDHPVREKADQPDPADMGPENTTGYLSTLRTEDAADVEDTALGTTSDSGGMGATSGGTGGQTPGSSTGSTGSSS